MRCLRSMVVYGGTASRQPPAFNYVDLTYKPNAGLNNADCQDSKKRKLGRYLVAEMSSQGRPTVF